MIEIQLRFRQEIDKALQATNQPCEFCWQTNADHLVFACTGRFVDWQYICRGCRDSPDQFKNSDGKPFADKFHFLPFTNK